MITWFSDEEIEIIFDKIPDVSIRFAYPTNNNNEIKEIYKKPFINNEEIKTKIIDIENEEEYCFTIPKNYTWDGASIPRIFWRLIGSKTDSKFLIPSLVHDIICENHHFIDNNRYLSTIIFDKLLIVSKINPFSRWIIKHSVDNYQKFCKWK